LTAAALIAAVPSAVAQPRAAWPLAPRAAETFDAWCRRLQSAEPFVPFRCLREDDWTEPGHPSRTLRVRFAGGDVARAFELGRALFGMPASVVPPRTGPREQTVEDPAKPAEVWESTLTVRRGADGVPRELRWSEAAKARAAPCSPAASMHVRSRCPRRRSRTEPGPRPQGCHPPSTLRSPCVAAPSSIW
jgi:hypothetical protein